jgi:hypothetical protein
MSVIQDGGASRDSIRVTPVSVLGLGFGNNVLSKYYLIYLRNTYGTFSLLFFVDAPLSRARLTPKDSANWTANPEDLTNVLQFLRAQRRPRNDLYLELD